VHNPVTLAAVQRSKRSCWRRCQPWPKRKRHPAPPPHPPPPPSPFCSYLSQAGASSNKKMSDFFSSLQAMVLAFQRLHRALSDSTSVRAQFLDKTATLYQQVSGFGFRVSGLGFGFFIY